MKDEYDFSQAERGKFYRPGAKLTLPVYLEEEVQRYLAQRASERGIELSELVNKLLRKDIELIESGK
jgi:hypothetical protein